MSKTSSGRCLCGAITFTAEGVEPHHHACHCGMCRRWSGGAPFFAASTENVEFTAGAEHIVRYASSSWAQRGFCGICGTALFYFLEPTQAYMMSVGTFDDPSQFELVLEIFVDNKPEGYAFAGEHGRLTEAETLARLGPPA